MMTNSSTMTARRSALGILRHDVLIDVIFRGEEKIYTEFIIIDTFGSGSAFEKRKVALLSKQDCLNILSKCCSRRFSQLRIAGSSTPFLRHFRVGMRRVIGTYMF